MNQSMIVIITGGIVTMTSIIRSFTDATPERRYLGLRLNYDVVSCIAPQPDKSAGTRIHIEQKVSAGEIIELSRCARPMAICLSPGSRILHDSLCRTRYSDCAWGVLS